MECQSCSLTVLADWAAAMLLSNLWFARHPRVAVIAFSGIHLTTRPKVAEAIVDDGTPDYLKWLAESMV
jgi:hypothetical protein